jgi:dTDP-glucose pyrophosphorylase
VSNQQPIRPEDITAVIPAAGKVPEGVLTLTNVKSPALIPVAGRPVIDWTIRYLSKLGIKKFLIAVAERGSFLEDFVDCSFGETVQIKYVVPSRDGGVGFTVLELLREVDTSSCLVVLGDTHFEFADSSSLLSKDPYVLTTEVANSSRWCVAKLSKGDVIESLHDKETDIEGPLNALIGVYGFPNTQDVLSAAEQAEMSPGANGGRIELSSILNGLSTPGSSLRAITAGKWIDVGNADRHASSHRTLLQSRTFNQLEIDPVFGTITKRSGEVKKFINEINYLRLLPDKLSVLFPRLLDYSVDWTAPFARMEYYGYPTLAEIFLFENVDPTHWEHVFHHLHSIIREGFMKYSRPLSHDAMWGMYIEKTETRLASDKISADLRKLIDYEGSFTINGKEIPNLRQSWNQIRGLVRNWGLNAEATIIHGDLCLSNILYDIRSRICKLIDPRGSFHAEGIFGDPMYDVAKIHHSVYGLYDFIVNDVFDIEIDGTVIDFRIRSRPQHALINDRFDKVFFSTFDRREILLRTAFLFASMPALHYDAPKRQLAMYVRALQLFDEALQS